MIILSPLSNGVEFARLHLLAGIYYKSGTINSKRTACKLKEIRTNLSKTAFHIGMVIFKTKNN